MVGRDSWLAERASENVGHESVMVGKELLILDNWLLMLGNPVVA
jgi:hypothetical protein